MTTFFTADTHFGHGNIINFSKRPFADAAAMDAALVARWNQTVGPTDEVFHLGDFAYRQTSGSLRPIFDRLNGRKYLVIGNHDNAEVLSLPWHEPPVHYREDLLTTQDRIVKLVLSHYSFRAWNGQFHGSINLYGHTHSNLPDCAQACDVGTDCWDYRPVSLAQVLSYLGQRRKILPEAQRLLA